MLRTHGTVVPCACSPSYERVNTCFAQMRGPAGLSLRVVGCKIISNTETDSEFRESLELRESYVDSASTLASNSCYRASFVLVLVVVSMPPPARICVAEQDVAPLRNAAARETALR